MKILSYLAGPIKTNCYLTFDEESLEGFVVDPGAHCQKLLDDITKYGITLKYVVLTHGHGDHIGGVEELLELYPACQLLGGLKEEPLFLGKIDNSSREICGKDLILHCDKLLAEGDEITCGNMCFKVIETPGHTPGGICLYTPGVLFSGDTLFRQSIGRTDFPGGDQVALFKSIREKLYVLPEDTIVLPGHMEETQIGFEKRYNYFV
ncbi:MAG: MBL fold metallo-hydrolase [Clostridia bacterium]|nr:MBL fold metallo-hydrolase [Clostridia bacterium]